MDHHFCHILAGWNGKDNNGIAIDGCGDNKINETATNNIIKSIDENTFKYSLRTKDELGHLFKTLSTSIGLSDGDAVGKMMGLQSYGKQDDKLYDILAKTKSFEEAEKVLYENLSGIDIYDQKQNFDALYTAHKWVGDKIIKKFKENFNFGDRVLYSGGCALNTVTNTILDEKYDLKIFPAANDSGCSVGAMKLMLYLNGYDVSKMEVRKNNKISSPKKDVLEEAAELLKNGNIIGFCCSEDEIGPRALGNRSILMNPCIENGKDIINRDVKHREWWRPFGGTIIDSNILEKYKKSDLDFFMLKNSKFKKGFRKDFSSINHVDDTSRLQILSEENRDLPIYKLIEIFNKKTGLPGLLNTSYNIQSKPIPKYPTDIAITFLSMPKVRYLVYGDRIVDKKKDDIFSIIKTK